MTLRRNNFRHQLFEDSQIDKEVDIRKRILKDFNKKEEDFEQLSEWNDYLEMVEDIIFNLTNGVDILGTNKRIAEYKERNKDFISKNRYDSVTVDLKSFELIFQYRKLKAQAEPRGPRTAGHPGAGGAARQHPAEAARGGGRGGQEAEGGEQGEADRRPHVQRRRRGRHRLDAREGDGGDGAGEAAQVPHGHRGAECRIGYVRLKGADEGCIHYEIEKMF